MPAGRSGSISALTGTTSSAEQATSPAITAKTAPAPCSPSSSAARAGPARTLALSIQLETTLAEASWSGSRASDGSSEPWAGRVSVTAVAASAARA